MIITKCGKVATLRHSYDVVEESQLVAIQAIRHAQRVTTFPETLQECANLFISKALRERLELRIC